MRALGRRVRARSCAEPCLQGGGDKECFWQSQHLKNGSHALAKNCGLHTRPAGSGTLRANDAFSRSRRILAGRRPGKRSNGGSATRRRTRRGRCGRLCGQRHRNRDWVRTQQRGSRGAAEGQQSAAAAPLWRPSGEGAPLGRRVWA